MKKDKTIIFILGLVVAVGLFSGCNLFQKEAPAPEKEGSRLSLMKKETKDTKKPEVTDISDAVGLEKDAVEKEVAKMGTINRKNDQETLADAMRAKDVKMCEDIKDEDAKSYCHNIISYDIAVAAKNSKLCDDITNKKQKVQCKDQIAAVKAQIEGDEQECDTISETGLKEGCKTTIRIRETIEAGDAADCARYTSEKLKNICLEKAGEKKDALIYQDAVSNEDVGKCSKIISRQLRDKCASSINFTLARKEKDVKYCDNIIDANSKNSCYSTVLLSLAREELDITLCDQIKIQADKDVCTASVAAGLDIQYFTAVKKTGDATLCVKITNDALREKCEERL